MAAIDELRERLREMDRRQANWNVTFHRAYARVRRERVGRFRRPSATQEAEIAEEARRVTGEDFALEMFAFLDELCDAYLAEPLPQNRAKLRADVGGLETLLSTLWFYARQNIDLVRSSEDCPRLVHALCAISLDDLRADAEDVDELLANAWLAAARAGVDPRPEFARVAAVSNPGMGGGGAFMKNHLEGFEGSLPYRRLVEPALTRRGA